MIETHQLVSGADPEVALYDGIAFYESGDVYNALTCWRELLRLVPEHEVAQRYVDFVQGYLGLGDQYSEREVDVAQRRELNKLRGDQSEPSAPVAQSTEAFDPSAVAEASTSSAPPPPESIRIRHGASATSTHMAAGLMVDHEESAEDLIEEEMVTKRPEEVLPETLLASPSALPLQMRPPAPLPMPNGSIQTVKSDPQDQVKEMANSPIAKEAIQGDAGPLTQADGLTIQALSRQLADFHRSGKYEEAVATAKQLLTQDPQHAVARRYIDEYHRQKQAALQAALRKQKSAPENAAVVKSSLSIETKVSAAPIAMDQLEEAPTTAPTQVQAEPDLEPVINDFTYRPKVKMKSDQISWRAFDHRAGFFMSQVDGNTSYEDLIVISAMPREQAIQILSQLINNGVIG